jgi:hypothetical protein
MRIIFSFLSWNFIKFLFKNNLLKRIYNMGIKVEIFTELNIFY